MISPLLYATWLLCGLGAVVFVSAAQRSWQTLVWTSVGFALSIWLPTDPQRIGLLAAVASVIMIVKPQWHWFAAFTAGMLVGPLDYSIWYVAFALSAVMAAFAIPLPRRIIREEALAGLALFGLLLALAPSIAQGWQSALALNVANQTNSGQAVPNWVLLLVTGCVLIGGLYQSIYRRR